MLIPFVDLIFCTMYILHDVLGGVRLLLVLLVFANGAALDALSLMRLVLLSHRKWLLADIHVVICRPATSSLQDSITSFCHPLLGPTTHVLCFRTWLPSTYPTSKPANSIG
jgi:hypothetical protein